MNRTVNSLYPVPSLKQIPGNKTSEQSMCWGVATQGWAYAKKAHLPWWVKFSFGMIQQYNNVKLHNSTQQLELTVKKENKGTNLSIRR